tara:strand:- start:690 stop:1373 length:684 start_codon:yes stop_codon:yes gene_type:complete
MGLNHIFPTPIYTIRADGKKLNEIQDELWGVYNKINMQHLPFCPDAHDVSTDKEGNFFRGCLLQAYSCKYFLAFLDHSIKSYIHSIEHSQTTMHNDKQMGLHWDGKNEYTITESWFTRTKKGMYAPHHNHGDSDISGVYYLDTNGEDGRIKILSPNRYFVGNFIYGLTTRGGEQSIKLQNGVLGLWPSILDHSTEANETDHDRISLSFNIVMNENALTSNNKEHKYY